MNRLDFGFLKYDDILEARVENGHYHISPDKTGFAITAYVNQKLHTIGKSNNIYDALDLANKHYEKLTAH